MKLALTLLVISASFERPDSELGAPIASSLTTERTLSILAMACSTAALSASVGHCAGDQEPRTDL